MPILAGGKVDRKLVLEGVPPDRPLPLEFVYTLPEDTECTIQIFNDKNENVRILVPQQQRLGGRNTERWDGCDDNGNLLPAGTHVLNGDQALAAEPGFHGDAPQGGGSAVIAVRQLSGHYSELVEQQPENGLALAPGPTAALGVVVEDGAVCAR